MTAETKQDEVSKSPTKLPAANIPTYKKPKHPYVASRPNTTAQKVYNPYAVTLTPTKIKVLTKDSVPSCKPSMIKQYSPGEYFPRLNTPTNSLGPGTKPAYVPAIHNLPPTQMAM
eukprot:14829070-Ditylum_brightwellii.AAC.1